VPNLRSKGVTKNSNAFICEKLLVDICVVGRGIIVLQEPATRLSLVRSKAPKSFQKSVHHFSVEFKANSLSFRYKFFVHDSLSTEENNQHGLPSRLLESKFVWPRWIFSNPCGWLSFRRWVVSKVPRSVANYDYFLGRKDYCPPPQSNLHMQQVGIFLFRSQCTRYKALANFHFFQTFSNSSVRYPCRWQTHPLSFEVTRDDFAITLAEPFPCCLPFETERGDHSWGRLEPLLALHATVRTSEIC
jgi:hypothetical protein